MSRPKDSKVINFRFFFQLVPYSSNKIKSSRLCFIKNIYAAINLYSLNGITSLSLLIILIIIYAYILFKFILSDSCFQVQNHKIFFSIYLIKNANKLKYRRISNYICINIKIKIKIKRGKLVNAHLCCTEGVECTSPLNKSLYNVFVNFNE